VRPSSHDLLTLLNVLELVMKRTSFLFSTVGLVFLVAACSSAGNDDTDSSASEVVGEPCPTLSPPAPGFCADGEIVTTTDDNGCHGYECVRAATCASVGGQCVGLSPTSCPSGRWADANEITCGPGIGAGCCLPECPALSPPHPSFCADGRIKPRKDATGCTVGFDCLPECPALSPPHPSFCPDGTIVPRKDDTGCVVGFDCVAPAPNACEAAGGACVGLSPSSCPSGNWADASTHGCGGAVGVGCCLP
jgi:hypothetical protein